MALPGSRFTERLPSPLTLSVVMAVYNEAETVMTEAQKTQARALITQEREAMRQRHEAMRQQRGR